MKTGGGGGEGDKPMAFEFALPSQLKILIGSFLEICQQSVNMHKLLSTIFHSPMFFCFLLDRLSWKRRTARSLLYHGTYVPCNDLCDSEILLLFSVKLL